MTERTEHGKKTAGSDDEMVSGAEQRGDIDDSERIPEDITPDAESEAVRSGMMSATSMGAGAPPREAGAVDQA